MEDEEQSPEHLGAPVQNEKKMKRHKNLAGRMLKLKDTMKRRMSIGGRRSSLMGDPNQFDDTRMRSQSELTLPLSRSDSVESMDSLASFISPTSPGYFNRLSHISDSSGEDHIQTGPVIAKAVVKKDYTPSPYDTDALRLKTGDVIDVFSMPSTGTWTGVLRGKVGTFKFINVDIVSDETPKNKRRSRTPRHHKHTQRRPRTTEELLKRLCLEKYISVFMLNDYDLERFGELEEEDLDDLQIVSSEDRAKILTAAELLHDYDGDAEPAHVQQQQPEVAAEVTSRGEIRDSGIYASSDCLQMTKPADVDVSATTTTTTAASSSSSAPATLKRQDAVRTKQKQERISKFYVNICPPEEGSGKRQTPGSDADVKSTMPSETASAAIKTKAEPTKTPSDGKSSADWKTASVKSKAKPGKEHTKALRMSVNISPLVGVPGIDDSIHATQSCEALVEPSAPTARVKSSPPLEDSVFSASPASKQRVRLTATHHADGCKKLFSDSNVNYGEVRFRSKGGFGQRAATLPRPPSDERKRESTPSARPSARGHQSRVKTIIETFQGLRTWRESSLRPLSSAVAERSMTAVPSVVEAMLRRKLGEEGIDLTKEPYTTGKDGVGDIPPALITRYAAELCYHASEIANAMETLRVTQLREKQKPAVFSDKLSEARLLTSTPVYNYSSVQDWLTSLGLPMYTDNLMKQGYSQIEQVAMLRRTELEALGISKASHLSTLSAACDHLRQHLRKYGIVN